MNMNAAVVEAPQKLVYTQVPRPTLQKGQVLVAVKYCGICGTDMHILYDGSLRYPHIPGHELTGVVVEAADEEGAALVGKEVTSYGIIGCMNCEYCAKEDYTKCPSYHFIGASLDGAFAEYAVYPVKNIIPLDGIPLREGALVEPTAVTVHAVHRLSHVPELAVVIGAGPIGLLTAHVLKAMGAETTLVLDVDDHKVDLARSMGFEHSINSATTSVMDKLASLGYPKGAPAIVECSGSVPGLNSALSIAKPGGEIVMVGMFSSDVLLKHNNCHGIMRKELRVSGSWISNHSDWYEAMQLIRDGKINCNAIITNEVSLEDAPAAMEQLHNAPGKDIKTLIKIS